MVLSSFVCKIFYIKYLVYYVASFCHRLLRQNLIYVYVLIVDKACKNSKLIKSFFFYSKTFTYLAAHN